MNSMQVIMCAYVYVTFLSNTLLTIPDEILMLLKGSGLKTLKSVYLKSAHCNNLKRKDCPFCCCTQQIRESVVALYLVVKFSKVFLISEIPGLVLIYRR